MTTRLTVPADVVLNLTVWAREQVEHETEEAAWDALERDSLMLINCDVYVEEDGEFIPFLTPTKARVTGYETRRGLVNRNEDWKYVHLDPYVDVEVEGHGAAYTYGRTHFWRKE
jgi:hypothetical protein